jgi:hypothetical protein
MLEEVQEQDHGPDVLHFSHMGNTLTIRLPPALAAWLAETAEQTGRTQGAIVREQLQKARAAAEARPFMRLAGTVHGPRDLSARKGFSRS